MFDLRFHSSFFSFLSLFTFKPFDVGARGQHTNVGATNDILRPGCKSAETFYFLFFYMNCRSAFRNFEFFLKFMRVLATLGPSPVSFTPVRDLFPDLHNTADVYVPIVAELMLPLFHCRCQRHMRLAGVGDASE
jgi:hypothetical protein